MLFLAIFSISATSNAQEARVSLDLENVSVGEVFDAIKSQTHYSFWYDLKDVDINRVVSVKAENRSVREVLKVILKNDVEVRVLDDHIIIVPATLAGAEKRKITGTIVDQNGEPVIGANVVEKGTTNGTVTDIDGKFSLNVSSDNATLIISYIGYLEQQLLVKDQKNWNLVLKEDSQSLEEVVVVGYGTQKKVNLTGAVSSVKFDEEMSNRPITDASQALSGKVSGVWVSQNIGKPGSDGAQLRIRGWGTLNNSDPLVIIDGVEGSFGQVNPNDIESISVLKDAASAAIYGSKAANGVVLVTTKMGKNKEKTQVELNSYVGIQQLGRRYDFVTNSADLMTLINQGFEHDGALPLFSEQLITDFRSGTDPYKYPNTDWYEELFRNALITNHNLSIRGGTDKLSSFVSFNYLKQDGNYSANRQ